MNMCKHQVNRKNGASNDIEIVNKTCNSIFRLIIKHEVNLLCVVKVSSSFSSKSQTCEICVGHVYVGHVLTTYVLTTHVLAMCCGYKLQRHI